MITIFNLAPNGLWKKRGLHRWLTCGTLALGFGLAASTLAKSSTAQGPPNPKEITGVEQPALSDQAQAVTPSPDAPAVPLTPEQMPPLPPQVTYVNGQLTIIAENCSLGDILAAVHKLTGVQVSLPVNASAERMAARVGPGSTRDVLSNLLGSTNYNFIIQAADDDPNEVQSLMLIPRSKAPARNSGRALAARPGMRRPVEPPPAAEDATATESQAAAPQPTETPDSAQASSQPVSADAGVTPTPAAQADLRPSPDGTATADAGQSSMSPSDQMMQGLQRLYEQRRQMMMQQQQNPQGQPKAPGTN